MRASIRPGRLAHLVSTTILALSIAACSSSGDILDTSGAGNPTPSDLTSAASNPASGNATLTAAAVLVLNANGGGFDELTLDQITGEYSHKVVVTWDTVTRQIQGASHVWGQGPSHGGPTSGFTACFAGINDCDPAKVVLDFDGKTVTFSAQVLDDVFGGAATSTLSGTVGW